VRTVSMRTLLAADWLVTGAFSKLGAPYTGSGRDWLAGDWPSRGAFSTLLRQSGLRSSTGGVLATKSEHKMLASTCLYSLYTWLRTVTSVCARVATAVEGCAVAVSDCGCCCSRVDVQSSELR